jgi:UDP-N-acetylglucosamine acyltransferase
MEIHPTAIIDKTAEISSDVDIGPYCYIGPKVILGQGCRIGPQVVILEGTKIGKNCSIYPGAIIGCEPQDYKFKDLRSNVEIGNDNIIREYVTIHRSSEAEGKTVVGNNNFLMAYAHIAHDCKVGNQVVITNYTGLSGYVTVEDKAIVSGYVAIHQFCRIGELAIISAQTGLSKDVPPFMIGEGRPCLIRGINVIGLRRNGISPDVRLDIQRAYRILFRSRLNTTKALERIKEEIEMGREITHLVNFIENSQRGIHKAKGEIEEGQKA